MGALLVAYPVIIASVPSETDWLVGPLPDLDDSHAMDTGYRFFIALIAMW